MKSAPDNSDNTIDQYQLQQRRYWAQLREELQQYKVDLGATNSELAEGLSISRQPLVSFIREARPDLPIQRLHLIRLWERLSASDKRSSKRLSEENLINRQVLRSAGSNRLLRAAGFLPDDDGLQLEVNSERYQQIQRIVSGLSNIPVRDDSDFVDLVDALETEVVSKAFGFKRLLPNLAAQKFSYDSSSESEIAQWADKWIKENLHMKPISFIESRFKRSLYKLIRQGKYDLNDREIFELYLSILENNRIDTKTRSGCKIRITQCQFTNLTFSILSLDLSEDQHFRENLMHVFLKAEAQLRFSVEEYTQPNGVQEQRKDLERLVSDVVTEASVTCFFRMSGQNDSLGESVRWCYSSSATHFENMFTAIYKGMGCEGDLELVDFSTSSLGKRSNSLVKSSTTFKSREGSRLHQGVWVDSSAVVGTAQSVAVAVKSWLSDNLSDPAAYRDYYEACIAIAKMDYSLRHGCKFLSDYVLQQREEDPLAAPAKEYLIDQVVIPIERLLNGTLSSIPALKSWYGLNLGRKYCWAQIACARSAFVEGNVKKAAEFLDNTDMMLAIPGVSDDVPLALRLNLEKMLLPFYGGNQEFIADRGWRQSLQTNLQALREYIYTRKSSSLHRRYCGRLDSDVYLCASEIFARAGRLEFTFATEVEEKYLEQSVDNLLMAAYYSSKVGEHQRTAHWLANASRVYCRLGNGDNAGKLANIAERVLKRAIDQRYGLQYKEAIMAEVDISRGEKLLLIEQEPLLALQSFGKAVQGASYLGFVRLLADSLYNVSRAAEDLDSAVDVDVVLGHYGNEKKQPPNRIVKEVVDFLVNLDQTLLWSDVAVQFRQQAQKIWHHWAVTVADNQNVVHPLEGKIIEGSYLQRVR